MPISSRGRQSGQVIIEYVLLLLIGLTVGNILIKSLTASSDDPDKQGMLIKRWIRIWDGVGKDYPDK